MSTGKPEHYEHEHDHDHDDEEQEEKIEITKPTFVTIEELEPLNCGFSIVVKVVEVREKLNRTNLDGTQLRINEAIVGDETGCITLTVRDKIMEHVKVGNTLILRNVKIEMYRSYMRLGVDRWGLVEISPESIEGDVDVKNDKSSVEYELVDPNDEKAAVHEDNKQEH